VRYVAILGDRELGEGLVTLRDLDSGEQRSLQQSELAVAVEA
jgi:histidyl-tRNA synthetase